ncbi:prolyl-tRNA synthetase associated domain-containing protein [uncultured Sphaerochaeta sp.]|uniref:prolyl-tRNA synthetase associated domain-containing protein n=1 Tax=uncultured Sphaerochaeta sp. TaxID=886478 RepID=UPI002A0A499A|nr:prolyl-tRNA synthetase associated domain-containing protein [uncultured Sphaerochaeta sp.]
MKEIVKDTLERLSIPYRLVTHQAAATMEEMENLKLGLDCTEIKNLFLRDHKGRRFFLVCVRGNKQVRLKELASRLAVAGGLSFASEQQLETLLKLAPGSVTPLGILNDEQRTVTVVLDSEFLPTESVGVHPNENTSSLILLFSDLVRIIEEHQNPLCYRELT